MTSSVKAGIFLPISEAVDTTWGTTVPTTRASTTATDTMDSVRHRGLLTFPALFPCHRPRTFSSKARMGMFSTKAMTPPTKNGDTMPTRNAAPRSTSWLYMIASTNSAAKTIKCLICLIFPLLNSICPYLLLKCFPFLIVCFCRRFRALGASRVHPISTVFPAKANPYL